MPEVTSEKTLKGLDKRRLIVDAAIKVFAEKGYHGTRISDIAHHAEIAYGLVYHYFKNKEEILDTISLERWGGVHRRGQGDCRRLQTMGVAWRTSFFRLPR
jgi:AcrR family transcriptional regulator